MNLSKAFICRGAQVQRLLLCGDQLLRGEPRDPGQQAVRSWRRTGPSRTNAAGILTRGGINWSANGGTSKPIAPARLSQLYSDNAVLWDTNVCDGSFSASGNSFTPGQLPRRVRDVRDRRRNDGGPAVGLPPVPQLVAFAPQEADRPPRPADPLPHEESTRRSTGPSPALATTLSTRTRSTGS